MEKKGKKVRKNDGVDGKKPKDKKDTTIKQC
jgi:hypothetical protein